LQWNEDDTRSYVGIFFAHFVKKEKWAYDICVPISTLEQVDRFLQNLIRTLYAMRGIPKAMVFNFMQLVRATWQVHELVGWWVGGWGAALTTFCLGS
jgi:hypothetical protein